MSVPRRMADRPKSLTCKEDRTQEEGRGRQGRWFAGRRAQVVDLWEGDSARRARRRLGQAGKTLSGNSGDPRLVRAHQAGSPSLPAPYLALPAARVLGAGGEQNIGGCQVTCGTGPGKWWVRGASEALGATPPTTSLPGCAADGSLAPSSRACSHGMLRASGHGPEHR